MSWDGKQEWQDFIIDEADERGLTLDWGELEKCALMERHEEVEKYLDELATEREHGDEAGAGIDNVNL